MIVIIGSGVAGLSCALAAVRAGRTPDASVVLVTPGRLTEGGSSLAGGSTVLAQGGIAAALAPGDSPAAHLADTVAAGVGLVDIEAAAVLTSEGARVMQRVLDEGFPADRDSSGELLFGLEAAHSCARVLHAGGDRTGAVLHDFLAEQVQAESHSGSLMLLEDHAVESLLLDAGAIAGVRLQPLGGSGVSPISLRAQAVVMATGGYAAHYERSTNPSSSRGEGIVVAARAGAAVADLEFVQFHPTVLRGTGVLISEAVRGAGAVLRDGSGRRFMLERHPRAELAPRDVVARECDNVLHRDGASEVWLDATGLERAGGAGFLARRFPGISAAMAAQGYSWGRELVPVSPAAHYTMGGIATDLDGRSTVPGLFAVGEAALTGVHGANRLASNSLLEGLVFGERAGMAAVDAVRNSADHVWHANGSGFQALVHGAESPPIPPAVRAGDTSAALTAMIDLAVASREESRGAHQRVEYPETDPAQAYRRAFIFPPSAPEPSDSDGVVGVDGDHPQTLRSNAPC